MHDNSEINLHPDAMIQFMVKIEIVQFDPTYDINVCSCSEVIRGVNLNGKVKDMRIFLTLSIIILFSS